MINDSERRVVAARLRNASARHVDEPWMVEDLMLALGFRCYEDGEDQLFDRLANLIDRPTATATMDYEAMEDGIPDCRIWTCNGCKESFPAYRGFYPTYCPVCGMEIEK